MNENLNANEVKNEENCESQIVEEVKESKIKVAANKAGGAMKKHGKKILAGVGVGLLTVVAYGLGKHSMMDDEIDYVSDEEFIGLEEAEEDVVEDDAE